MAGMNAREADELQLIGKSVTSVIGRKVSRLCGEEGPWRPWEGRAVPELGLKGNKGRKCTPGVH